MLKNTNILIANLILSVLMWTVALFKLNKETDTTEIKKKNTWHIRSPFKTTVSAKII